MFIKIRLEIESFPAAESKLVIFSSEDLHAKIPMIFSPDLKLWSHGHTSFTRRVCLLFVQVNG